MFAVNILSVLECLFQCFINREREAQTFKLKSWEHRRKLHEYLVLPIAPVVYNCFEWTNPLKGVMENAIVLIIVEVYQIYP